MPTTLQFRPDAKILIVEDDPIARGLLVLTLDDEGFQVETATNGIEALRKVRDARPDLVVLDLQMPRMDGWEFRAAQKADPDVANIPVIVISGDGSPQAVAIHATHYLRKPFDPADLTAAIRRVLQDRDRRLMEARLLQAALFGEDRVKCTAIPLAILLESVLAMASTEIGEKAKLTGDVHGAPTIAGNEAQLARVFISLVDLAARAIPAGLPDPQEIVVGASARNGQAQVEVALRGHPPFERGLTDLGLAVSRNTVTSHGGRIDVEHTAGRGPMFRVLLPLAASTHTIGNSRDRANA